MQHFGIAAAVFLLFSVLACGAAPNDNDKAPSPSSPDLQKRNAPVYGNLRVYVKYGYGLPDRDGFLAGKSDPYVRVTAVDNYGGRVTHNTRHIQGDHSPHWYQWLYFGTRNWHHLEMSVWDSDFGADDRLTSTQTVHLRRGYYSNVRHCCTVYFDYYIS